MAGDNDSQKFQNWLSLWGTPALVAVFGIIGASFLSGIQSQLSSVQGDVSGLGTRIDHVNSRIDDSVGRVTQRVDKLLEDNSGIRQQLAVVAGDTSYLRARADATERTIIRYDDHISKLRLAPAIAYFSGHGSVAQTSIGYIDDDGQVIVIPTDENARAALENKGWVKKELPSGVEGYAAPSMER
ncbi:hypothetical protein JL101_029205 (plasmid) [Skermanella rosea]|uniref:hypothetical protein n=1 Tax=Skermanella rosea TaxID=1817965 RepID=UPI001931D8EC|nr:hypothetical protein [Skermanella rosea]UEM07083.1 hypothetical protein JL101_029205 [Skermanella rosea]